MLEFFGVIFLISVALAIIVKFPLVRYFMTFILTFLVSVFIILYAYGSYSDKLAVYALCGGVIFCGFVGLGALILKIAPSAKPISFGMYYGALIPALFCVVMFIGTKLHFF